MGQIGSKAPLAPLGQQQQFFYFMACTFQYPTRHEIPPIYLLYRQHYEGMQFYSAHTAERVYRLRVLLDTCSRFEGIQSTVVLFRKYPK
jgi:hypothetical protein